MCEPIVKPLKETEDSKTQELWQNLYNAWNNTRFKFKKKKTVFKLTKKN